MILNKGVRYEERGPAVSENSRRVRTSRMIRTLRKLGYRVELARGSDGFVVAETTVDDLEDVSFMLSSIGSLMEKAAHVPVTLFGEPGL